MAEKFAQEGCNVVINYMTSEAHAKEVLAKIRASVGENDGASARTLGLVQGVRLFPPYTGARWLI